MLTDEQVSRLRWRSRRGLLENDLMLEKFYARHLGSLDENRLKGLDELLELGDNDLWDLFSGRSEPDARFSAMAKTILHEVRAG
jgi:antitoxin CptB